MLTCRSLLACALLASTFVAQSFVSPRGMTNCYANGQNLVPFGRPAPTSAQGEVFYQQLDDELVGLPRALKGFTFRHRYANVVAVPWTYNLTVRLGDAATMSAGISMTFANNWKTGRTPTTVFTGSVTFPAVPAYARPPAPPDAPLPFSIPYVHLGTDPLLWEVYIQATTSPTSGTSSHERGYVVASVTYIPGMLGTGCTITGGSTPMDSSGTISQSAMTETLLNGPANAAAVLLLGDDADRLGGTVPLPIDLAIIGSAGCFLRINSLATFPYTTSGSGGASHTLAYAIAPALSGLRLRTQWGAVDGANVVRTSNGLDYCVPFVTAGGKAWPHQSVYSSNFGATPPATAYALYASGHVTVWQQ